MGFTVWVNCPKFSFFVGGFPLRDNIDIDVLADLKSICSEFYLFSYLNLSFFDAFYIISCGCDETLVYTVAEIQ